MIFFHCGVYRFDWPIVLNDTETKTAGRNLTAQWR